MAIQVHFVHADGRRETVAAAPGDTLLDAALDNGVAGIIGQCGGGCTCCTCHCYVGEPWAAQLPVPHADEGELLTYAWQPRAHSRLACQVPLTAALDGIEVAIPACQS